MRARVPSIISRPSFGIDLDQSCSPATRSGASRPTSPAGPAKMALVLNPSATQANVAQSRIGEHLKLVLSVIDRQVH
jgi:hypothetical protein